MYELARGAHDNFAIEIKSECLPRRRPSPARKKQYTVHINKGAKKYCRKESRGQEDKK